jgi:cell filamentation protein
LIARPQRGAFDAGHVQAIHRYLFQDVYAWAGQFRTVSISRNGQFLYAFPQQIGPSLSNIAAGLRTERHLAGLDRDSFCRRAGHYMGELNAIHPFRDGNGRTQREFIRQLSARNGYVLDWSHTSRDQVYEASRVSFQTGDNSGMVEIVRAAIDTPENERIDELRRRARSIKKGKASDERERE